MQPSHHLSTLLCSDGHENACNASRDFPAILVASIPWARVSSHESLRTWPLDVGDNTRGWKKMSDGCQPFHSWGWSIPNFACSLTRNTLLHHTSWRTWVLIHSLLRWMMIIPTNYHYITYSTHLFLKIVGRMCLSNLGVKGLIQYCYQQLMVPL